MCCFASLRLYFPSQECDDTSKKGSAQGSLSRLSLLGHDTTASVISWVLYNLAMHQEYQDRCRSEINALLEGRDTEELMWFASHLFP